MPVQGLLARDEPLELAPDGRSVLTSHREGDRGAVTRVDFASGTRTKIQELAPSGRAGLLFVRPRVYRDNGRQYVYDYHTQTSQLFLVQRAR